MTARDRRARHRRLPRFRVASTAAMPNCGGSSRTRPPSAICAFATSNPLARSMRTSYAPGSTPSSTFAPARLVELDDQLLRRVADEEPAFELLAEHERRRGLADVGHHDVAGARQVDVVRRMLRAALGVDRPAAASR